MITELERDDLEKLIQGDPRYADPPDFDMALLAKVLLRIVDKFNEASEIWVVHKNTGSKTESYNDHNIHR